MQTIPCQGALLVLPEHGPVRAMVISAGVYLALGVLGTVLKATLVVRGIVLAPLVLPAWLVTSQALSMDVRPVQ